MRNYLSVAREHQALVVMPTPATLRYRIDTTHTGAFALLMSNVRLEYQHQLRTEQAHLQAHWQASQSGLSMLQNLMSLPGALPRSAAAKERVDGTATDGAFGAAAIAVPCWLDTAFMDPFDTVDFSAYVALVVRK